MFASMRDIVGKSKALSFLISFVSISSSLQQNDHLALGVFRLYHAFSLQATLDPACCCAAVLSVAVHYAFCYNLSRLMLQ
jgi:hypothetical protein